MWSCEDVQSAPLAYITKFDTLRQVFSIIRLIFRISIGNFLYDKIGNMTKKIFIHPYRMRPRNIQMFLSKNNINYRLINWSRLNRSYFLNRNCFLSYPQGIKLQRTIHETNCQNYLFSTLLFDFDWNQLCFNHGYLMDLSVCNFEVFLVHQRPIFEVQKRYESFWFVEQIYWSLILIVFDLKSSYEIIPVFENQLVLRLSDIHNSIKLGGLCLFKKTIFPRLHTSNPIWFDICITHTLKHDIILNLDYIYNKCLQPK